MFVTDIPKCFLPGSHPEVFTGCLNVYSLFLFSEIILHKKLVPEVIVREIAEKNPPILVIHSTRNLKRDSR